MVYFSTSDEWQRQSSLLLQARPTTTRITTKYKIPNLDEAKYSRPKKRRRGADDATTTTSNDTPKVPRAVLVLKTYDPESGVCLKFKTDRAAEVGRLITGLGRLGRHMAALPPVSEDMPMDDATAPASKQEDGLPAATTTANGPSAGDGKAGQQAQGGGGGGGGKKKKKNKK